ncbi:urate hydroxylase PuuD [Aurantimonas endophytica]|uniref:Putative membrane protein n=1 Tax=Aurantimonas endophytica TaxID=1522175 RepID=A0A7W6HDM6_9HYPH|nr:urate hydroxylase PuuD [Aurantimonas endophytica]MBB4003294.1 putative membrane protein [Aurantimonas endophytica]MCO6404155.1 cysteine desulfurase [Aurantimonas endophytica]
MWTYFAEWLSFGVRWVHVITAIAWVGSSFYFIALDLGLRRPRQLPEGVGGEAWQVHGGGFYHVQKYMVAPPHMPEDLTWFKWESYSTWLSGAALLFLVYYVGAELYLIDPTKADLPVWGATAIGIGGLALGWIVYDGLCKSPLKNNDTALLAALFVYVVAASFLFSQVFSGRGAMLHTGAMIATIMTANVFLTIIPNQTIVVSDLKAGRTPEARLGKEAKQRSLHNNYLTLPVIFLMLSNHYPLAFATEWNWAIAGLVLLIGAVIRHFFNTMHATGQQLWWCWAVAGVLFAVVITLSGAPGWRGGQAAEARTLQGDPAVALMASPLMSDVESIVLSRCSMCHAAEPLWPGIGHAPKDIRLESRDDIIHYAALIDRQAVRSVAMPPGNVTGLEPAERETLARWIAAGSGRYVAEARAP